MTIHTTHFRNLDNNVLYDMLQLRSEVFVVERNCVYQDLDGLDKKAMHFENDKGQKFTVDFQVSADRKNVAFVPGSSRQEVAQEQEREFRGIKPERPLNSRLMYFDLIELVRK